ncbi:aspartic peptidase domain-containing protein [Aspergillus floccosus]
MPSKLYLIPNPNYQKSGIKSYIHLMRKYRIRPIKEGPYSIGHTIHQTGRPFSDKPVGGRAIFRQVIQKNLHNGQTEPVRADDIQQDATCFLPVQIGTPPQTVHLVPDTASPDLWVRSSDLPRAEGHHFFDPSKSSTFKPTNRWPWEMLQLDGSSISGPIGIDKVALGDVTIQNREIKLASKLSSEYDQFSGDGILGLSVHSASSDARGIADGIWGQADLPPSGKFFTVKLGSWGPSKPFCSFGHIDQDVIADCTGDIHYAKVDSTSGVWKFESASAVVGEKAIDRPMNAAMADISAPLTLLDDAICQAIYDAIPGAFYDSECQGFIFPSNLSVDQRPCLQLDIGGRVVAMPKENLAFAEAKPGYMYGGIQSRGHGQLDILGANFLEGVYAIFDISGDRFGIAQAKELK